MIIGASCLTVGNFIRVIIYLFVMFRTIDINFYVELRFNVSLCRNAVHATMARYETLGQDQHEAGWSNAPWEIKWDIHFRS